MYSVHSVLHRLKFCVNPSGFTIKWYVLFSRLFNAVRGVVALRYFLSLLQIQPPGWFTKTKGKVKIEDAGFDWKILGPDVDHVDYVAWQCDQDAYACAGQKCSAQSILFAHENGVGAGLFDKMKGNAATRNLEDLSIAPVLTHTTQSILDHANQLLEIPGSKLLFGGKELANHKRAKGQSKLEIARGQRCKLLMVFL
eukprot:scaffold90494_cov38-Cyclotella_meneghiniana.AAC.5